MSAKDSCRTLPQSAVTLGVAVAKFVKRKKLDPLPQDIVQAMDKFRSEYTVGSQIYYYP